MRNLYSAFQNFKIHKNEFLEQRLLTQYPFMRNTTNSQQSEIICKIYIYNIHKI